MCCCWLCVIDVCAIYTQTGAKNFNFVLKYIIDVYFTWIYDDITQHHEHLAWMVILVHFFFFLFVFDLAFSLLRFSFFLYSLLKHILTDIRWLTHVCRRKRPQKPKFKSGSEHHLRLCSWNRSMMSENVHRTWSIWSRQYRNNCICVKMREHVHRSPVDYISMFCISRAIYKCAHPNDNTNIQDSSASEAREIMLCVPVQFFSHLFLTKISFIKFKRCENEKWYFIYI